MHAFQEGNFIKRLDFEQAAPGDVLSKSRKIYDRHEVNLSWIYFLVDFSHALHDPLFILTSAIIPLNGCLFHFPSVK
jgi:hypothetical protein